MTTQENFHQAVDQETYDRLASLFGEDEQNETKWVKIGAGSVDLVFFAPRKVSA